MPQNGNCYDVGGAEVGESFELLLRIEIRVKQGGGMLVAIWGKGVSWVLDARTWMEVESKIRGGRKRKVHVHPSNTATRAQIVLSVLERPIYEAWDKRVG